MDEKKFLLAGTVLGVESDAIVLQTTERRPSGDYPDEHVIFVDDAQDLVAPGNRIKVMGTIGVDPDDNRRLRLTAEAKNIRDHETALDTNIARVTGKLDRNFEFFPPVPEEGRKAFGNLLLVVDEAFYMRGVVLQAPAAIAIDRGKKHLYGAKVLIEGRIQTREFVANQGAANQEDRVALEVVVNKADILEPASSADPFKEFEEKTEAAV